MVKYRWQSVDYYDNTTVRAFEFKVVDGEKTAILGNREDVQVRDTTNQANILGDIVRKQEDVVKSFNVETDDLAEFEEKLKQELPKVESREIIEQKLKNYVKLYADYTSSYLQNIHYENACTTVFSNMLTPSAWLATEEALGRGSKSSSFFERLKRNWNAPTEEQKERAKNILGCISSQQKKSLGDFFDLLDKIPEKRRGSVYWGYFDGVNVFNDLEKGLRRLEDNIRKTSDEKSQEAIRVEAKKKFQEQWRDYVCTERDVAPWVGRFLEIKDKIDAYEPKISTAYHHIWDEKSGTKARQDAQNVIDKISWEQKLLETGFIADVVVTKNPDIDPTVLREVVQARAMGDYDIRHRMQKERRSYGEKISEEIKYEDLKAFFIANALEDRLRFEQYKKTGNVAFLASAEEVEKVQNMGIKEVIANYGSTMMSSYKNAAFVMEALKRDAEKGKNIAPSLELLTKMAGKKYQLETEFQPDGIKRFMFDAFMDMGGKSISKFSSNRAIYAGFAKALKGHDKKLSAQIDKFVTYVTVDTVDVSKRKKIIENRLKKRAEELEAKGNIVSGVHVNSEAEKEIQERTKEGYAVTDRNKVLQRKRGAKKPLTDCQKKLVERFKGKGK